MGDVVDVRPAIEGLESSSVRELVRQEFYRLAMSRGIARTGDIIDGLGGHGLTRPSGARMSGMIGRIDDLVELPNGWIASIADRASSGLTRYIRRMLAVYVRLPVALATAQLGVRKPAYRELDEAALAAFVIAHPDFVLDGERIVARLGLHLSENDELSRDERVIHQAIRDARVPLSSHQIERHTRRHAKVAPNHLKTALRESVVIVNLGDGTFDALQPSERIKSWVLGQASR
jgi:hypothetical protein